MTIGRDDCTRVYTYIDMHTRAASHSSLIPLKREDVLADGRRCRRTVMIVILRRVPPRNARLPIRRGSSPLARERERAN